MPTARNESSSWPERAMSADDALASLIRLSRNTAHEVSNALTAVLGYMDLAAGQLDEEHPSSDAIARAIRAAHAAASSVHGFSQEILRLNELLNEAYGSSGPKTLTGPVGINRSGADDPLSGQEDVAAAAPGTTGLVLFAVADTFVRSILLSGLRAVGNEIIVASDFEEVLRLCAELASCRPVLVVDSAIKGMNRGEGATRIRAKYPELPVILISTESSKLVEVQEGPQLIVLHRPFPVARLLSEINRCRWEKGDDSR